MTMNLPTGPAGDAAGRTLPGPSSPDWNDPAIIERIAGLPRTMLSGWEATPDELVATYGTADPDRLAAMCALDVDIADARAAVARLAGAA